MLQAGALLWELMEPGDGAALSGDIGGWMDELL